MIQGSAFAGRRSVFVSIATLALSLALGTTAAAAGGTPRLPRGLALAGNSLRASTTSDEQEARAGTATAGRSVQLFNGECQVEAVDLRIPGRGIDFELKRRYRSKTGFTDRTGETG